MAHPSPAVSASPREQLDDFFRKATTVLSEASPASEAQHEIRQLARLLFDVPGAARRVLEPEWSALSVVEREEFIRLFGDRLLWGYLSIVRGKLPGDRPPAIHLVGEDVGAAEIRSRRRRPVPDSAARERDCRRKACSLSPSPARCASEGGSAMMMKGSRKGSNTASTCLSVSR